MKTIMNISLSAFGLLLTASLFISTACMNGSPGKNDTNAQNAGQGGTQAVTDPPADSKTDKATFALGCFWHSEEMFSELKGVIDAVPGYCGGTEKNPSYEQVGTGATRYAESVDITFDPTIITYGQLLKVFFAEHDPTTPDYAAPDEGPQYRSVVFYHNADQQKQTNDYIATLTASKKYKAPIITEVTPYTTFYKAEAYHIHYFRIHPNEGYIASVTRPEVEKFRNDFKDWLKPGF